MPAGVFLLIAYVLPLLQLLAVSLTDEGSGSSGVYGQLAGSSEFWIILGRTVLICAVTTVVCLVLSYPLAWVIYGTGSQALRAALLVVTLLPLMVSAVIRSFGLILLLGYEGPVNLLLLKVGLLDEPARLTYNTLGVTIGLIYVSLPFMVLPLVASLSATDPDLVPAARSLGASSWSVLTRIVLPGTIPGMVTGCTLVFTMAMSNYVTPAMLGGGGFNVLTTLIAQDILVTYSWARGSAISVILIVIVLFVVGVGTMLSERRRND